MEQVIRRVKENKLFDSVIPLSIAGNINQIFGMECALPPPPYTGSTSVHLKQIFLLQNNNKIYPFIHSFIQSVSQSVSQSLQQLNFMHCVFLI